MKENIDLLVRFSLIHCPYFGSKELAYNYKDSYLGSLIHLSYMLVVSAKKISRKIHTAEIEK